MRFCTYCGRTLDGNGFCAICQKATLPPPFDASHPVLRTPAIIELRIRRTVLISAAVAVTAILLVIIALFGQKSRDLKAEPTTAHAVIPPGSSSAPPPAIVEALTLRPVAAKMVGDGDNALPGFVTSGPLFPSGTKIFPVLIEGALPRDLSITHLHYCKVDYVTDRSNELHIARARNLEMWVPPSAGIFCRTTIDRTSGKLQSAVDVRAAKDLPDGVYCLHTGDLGRGLPQPEFATPFVVGGIADVTIGNSTAVLRGDNLLFAVELGNRGQGQLDRSNIVITLQKENPNSTKPTFVQRWNEQVAALPAGDKTVFERNFATSSWAPGTYHLYGHVGSTESFSDSDSYGSFTTNKFIIYERESPQ